MEFAAMGWKMSVSIEREKIKLLFQIFWWNIFDGWLQMGVLITIIYEMQKLQHWRFDITIDSCDNLCKAR